VVSNNFWNFHPWSYLTHILKNWVETTNCSYKNWEFQTFPYIKNIYLKTSEEDYFWEDGRLPSPKLTALKMDGWKTILLCGFWLIFRGELLVSGSVYDWNFYLNTSGSHRRNGSAPYPKPWETFLRVFCPVWYFMYAAYGYGCLWLFSDKLVASYFIKAGASDGRVCFSMVCLQFLWQTTLLLPYFLGVDEDGWQDLWVSWIGSI